MSFSPIIRVRKLLDKMKTERGEQRSPKLQTKRFHRTATSDDLSQTYSPNMRPKKAAKSMASFNYLDSERSKVPQYLGEDQFLNLPLEATLFIFSFLEREDLQTIASVSKLWSTLANDESLWKQLLVLDFNITKMHCKTWKATYLRVEDLLADGIWEGHSKWVEPVGFDNEQRTSARLCFQKRTSRLPVPSDQSSNPSSTPSSPSVRAEIHRCASTTNPNQLTSLRLLTSQDAAAPTTDNTSSTPTPEEVKAPVKVPELKINGTGITVNCAAPSPFKIEGERAESDTTGTTFVWNKLFERHTSVYAGTIDYVEGTVTGTINYNDGNTHWKGEFHYKKTSRVKKYQTFLNYA